MSKHSARCHWIIERVTALALVPLCLWFIINLVSAVGAEAATATTFLQQPVNSVVMAALIIIGFWHMALGVGVVIEDYVHDTKKQKSFICLVKLVCALLAVTSLAAIAKIALA